MTVVMVMPYPDGNGEDGGERGDEEDGGNEAGDGDGNEAGGDQVEIK